MRSTAGCLRKVRCTAKILLKSLWWHLLALLSLSRTTADCIVNTALEVWSSSKGHCAAACQLRDAIVHDVVAMPTGIAQGLEALRKGGVAPKLLIIDDGWQSTQLDEALRPVSESGAVKSENKVSAMPGCLLHPPSEYMVQQ